MQALFRRTTPASIALALTLFASTANAQAIFGAAEVDDEDVSLFLLGGSWSPGGLGWKPLVSVVGYNLRFPSGLGGTLTRNVVTPSLGLINVLPDQSFSFSAGYAFSDDDTDIPLLVAAPSGDGVVGSFGWDYWGTTGRRAAQVLAAYNFGQEFLWSRGRASVPLTATSPLWVGGEVALYGGGDPSAYMAQFGPTIEYRFTPQFRLGGSAGLKVGVSNVTGNAVYGRVEFLWLPNAR
jgi:hypothetical protein